MWKKKPTEQLPWYRDPGYKGKMAEADKRKLDAIRMQPNHPAVTREDLPEAANSYISDLEMEVHDLHGQMSFSRTIVTSGLGAFLLYASIYGLKPMDDVFTRLGLIAMIIVPWFFFRRDSKKNEQRLLPEERSWFSTDEQLKYHWELDYISKARQTQSSEE